MKIQEIQPNQQSFGTKVKFEPKVIQMIQSESASLGRSVLKQARTLSHNRNNDYLYVFNRIDANNIPQVAVSALEKSGDKILVSGRETYSDISDSLNLIDMYNQVKEHMYEQYNDKNGIGKFLSFLV